MVLQVQASNDLDRLGDALMERLALHLQVADPLAVFAPEIVLVPTVGLRDWLRQRLATRFGICAGVELIYPGQLAEVLATRLGLVRQGHWDVEAARWRCLALLPAQEALQTYLAADGGRPGPRGYALATALVDCFDRYALYRPEATIGPWSRAETGPHDADEPWQPLLWRQLQAAGAGDPLHDHEALVGALRERPERAPARLQAFGFNNMAPRQLQLLAILAERAEVQVYSLQPSWGYWADDQRSLRELVRNGVPSCDWGNRLLGDWGAVGREFLTALDDVDAQYMADLADFRDPGEACLLHRIQRDLALARPAIEAPPHVLQPDDHSLSIHACHSLRRQLEVCKAALHQAFADDPGLKPHDVALMCPDPESVAGMAEAIFAGTSHGPSIAVAVADRRSRQLNPAADVVLRLLQLLPGRFTAGEVLDLLGCGAVAEAWGFDSDDLDRLRGWIDAADLRWGVDAAHRAACVDSPYAAASWRQGLQRLHLARWFGAETASARPFGSGDDPAEQVVPVTGLEPEDIDSLDRFTALLEPLLAAAADCRQPQRVEWWQETLCRLMRLVLRRREGDADVADVECAIANWVSGLRAIDWQEPVPATLVAAHVAACFDEQRGGDFGRGAVTICGMQPMRSVPFRMLFLVGMDDGAFPREHRAQDFDLLRRHPKPGDRNLRAEDRYLLLELLVSVRERLLICYQGYDARDQSALPPSILVGELIGQAAATCACSDDELAARLVQPHRLHGCLDDGERWPSSQLRDEWQALRGPRRPALPLPAAPSAASSAKPTAMAGDDALPRLDLDELVAFWLNPARAWLRVLGTSLPAEEQAPRDHERFTVLAGLDRFQVAERLLGDDTVAADRLLAEGALPPGAMGGYAWEALRDYVEPLRRRQAELLADCQERRWSCPVAGTELHGHERLLHPQHGLVAIYPAALNERRELACSIRLLAAAVAGLASTCTILTVHPSRGLEERVMAAPANAAEQLAVCLTGYRAGHQAPLPFTPILSKVYAAELSGQRPRPPAQALAKAERSWFSDPYGGGKAERLQPAYRLVWPDLPPCRHPDFADWAMAIWPPVIHALPARRGGRR